MEEEGEEEGVNFVSRPEVLHELMVPEVIPKGVGEEDIGMDKHSVGVVEGLGKQMGNLTALCKEWSSLPVLYIGVFDQL